MFSLKEEQKNGTLSLRKGFFLLWQEFSETLWRVRVWHIRTTHIKTPPLLQKWDWTKINVTNETFFQAKGHVKETDL